MRTTGLALVAAAACSGTPTAGNGPVALADVGLEEASLDRTADPCVDFYQFACGGWIARTEIPPDRGEWARFLEIEERTRDAIRRLLEEAARGDARDPATRQIGDYYASCMDEAAIDRAGVAPIRELLATTAGVTDDATWFAAVVALHRIGFQVVWSVHAGPDHKDSTTNILYLDTGGLELPDRDYYLEPRYAPKLAAYREHVAKQLALGGTRADRAAAAAGDVLAIATAIAQLTKPRVERRDAIASYNPTDAAGLARAATTIDWPAYWKALDIAPSAKIVLVAPRFFAELDALRARFAPAQWANYFTYHAITWQSFSLGKAIDDQDFELHRLMTGATERPPRRERCTEATTGALRDLVGERYVALHFPESSKRAVARLVDALANAMRDGITDLDWMSAATKQQAIAKLAKTVRMIGYPDRWRPHGFAVARGDFAGNELRRFAAGVRHRLGRAGKPVDRTEWHMSAFDMNAYYDRAVNVTAIAAGVLQPPLFGPSRSVAANLGSIGMVIGHELTHGFDDQGAKFDADGNLADWWLPADKAAFEARGACLAEQYSTFEVAPGRRVDGKLTLGENIADLGGVKTAFHAYRTLRSSGRATTAGGFTEDQQFFVAIGQFACGAQRPETLERTLATDTHAPLRFRVNGAVRNLPEFATAFGCAANTPMNPPRRCRIW